MNHNPFYRYTNYCAIPEIPGAQECQEDLKPKHTMKPFVLYCPATSCAKSVSLNSFFMAH